MERFEVDRGNQGLRRGVRQDIPVIDVTDRVMNRIAGSVPRRPSLARAMRSSTALASLFAVLLIVSVTAYATSEYIQIRNKAGDIKVQYVPPTARITDNPYEKYFIQAREFAKPGELVAFYAKDAIDLPLGPLQFHSQQERLNSYAEFGEAAERVGSRKFPLTLGGYTFEYGEITPAAPMIGTKLYLDTLEDLKDRASRAPEGEDVVMQAVPWTDASRVSAVYSNGESYVSVFSHFLNGMDVYVEQTDGDKTEKITIAGTEVVYNGFEKEHSSNGYMSWYDEDQDAYYTLINHKGGGVDKEKFLELAREWLEKKG